MPWTRAKPNGRRAKFNDSSSSITARVLSGSMLTSFVLNSHRLVSFMGVGKGGGEGKAHVRRVGNLGCGKRKERG